MATKFLEPGTAATFDTKFWSGSGGLVASDASVVGKRSLKLNTSNPAVSAYVYTPTVANAGGRVSVYIYLPSVSPSEAGSILALGASGLATQIEVFLDTGGHLGISLAGASPQVSYGTTVLSVNTAYHITLSWTWTSTTVNVTKLWINDVLELTRTNVTTGSFALSLFAPLVADTLGVNFINYYFDMYVDDSTALTNPGKIRVTAKRPNANGTTIGWLTQIGSGGSGYGSGHTPQINERALSTTNGWSTALLSTTEEYSIENQATGDADTTGATIVDFVGWVYAKASASVTASIIVAGASSNISLTTTITMFTKVAGSTTYPAGNTDIGMISSGSAGTDSLYECGILIAYIPNFTLNAVAGSYALSGVAATELAARMINAAAGSYAETGSDATPLAGRMMNAAAGAFSLSGVSMTALADRLINAGSGSYLIVGSDGTLVLGRFLSVDAGAYLLSGAQAGVLSDRVISTGVGTYLSVGADGTLSLGRILSVDAGSYLASGLNAGLIADRMLNVGPGTYVSVGSDGTLVLGRILSLNAGEYLLSGVSAGVLSDRLLAANLGTYALSGADTGLFRGFLIVADSGAYLVAGDDATLLAARMVNAAAGDYLVVGSEMSLVLGRVMDAGSGAYSVDGDLASLLADRLLNLQPGIYSLSGLLAVLEVSGISILPIGTVPVRYVVGQIANVVPVETVLVHTIGVVSVREFVGPAHVVPVREAIGETPRVKVRKV